MKILFDILYNNLHDMLTNIKRVYLEGHLIISDTINTSNDL